MITRGLSKGTIITRGYGGTAIVAAIWRKVVSFALCIKQIAQP